MSRISKDEYFTKMATLVAERGTCVRRKVGCVLVNKRGHVIATGYNGNAAGSIHCIDKPCPGAESPSGHGLETCQAIHAEANALLQCKDVYDIDTAYVTASPCVHCTKLLMNTSCERIVFLEYYPHHDAKWLWLEKPERLWEKYPPDEPPARGEYDDDIPF